MNHLERALAPIGRRMRLQRTVSWAVIGLFAGAVCALLLRGASFLWAFPAVARWSVAAFLGIPVLCALVSWLWPVTPMDAAREADASGLYARAQTALMLKDSTTPMADLQRRDTLDCLEKLEPGSMLPIRAPKPALIGLAVCAAVFALSFLIPNPQVEVLKAKADFRAEMKKQADLVDEGAAQMDADEAQTPELRKLLGDLAHELRQASDPKAALSALDEAERKMTNLQRTTGKNALKALNSSGLSDLAKALEQEDYELARELLSQQSTDAASESLASAAQSASDATAAQALAKAAQAMKSGNAAQALQLLQNAALGQNSASAQATALSAMVRSAAAQAGAQQASALQAVGLSAAQLGSMGMNGAAGQNGLGLLAAGNGGGAGLGSSNKDGGYSPSSASSPVHGQQNPQRKTAEYEAIYDPTRLGGDGETTNERGQQGQGEITEATIGTGLGSVGESVPYNRVLPQYRQSAVEAAQNANLPAYAQKWVETYFGSLTE